MQLFYLLGLRFALTTVQQYGKLNVSVINGVSRHIQ